jgi:hypothetical protein
LQVRLRAVAGIYLVYESPATVLLILFGFSAATITIFGCLHGRNRRSTTSTNRATSATTDIERPHGTCGHDEGQTQLEEVRSLSTETAGYIRNIKVDNEPQSTELPGPEVAALADLPSKPIQPLNIISAMRVPHEYINDLKIHGLIGLGACGRTYVASWKNQSVAVKIMDHFVRATNATALGKMPVLATVVDHPNVLPIHRVSDLYH